MRHNLHLLLGSLALLNVTAEASKGVLVDWALRLQLQTQNLSDYFGSQQRATIIREVPEEEFTSYSLILPSDCDHPDCIEASNNCSLTPTASQVTKLVLKATDQRDWVVECSLFGKVDIPVADGGLPGRRLSGPDRGRGVSAGSGGQAGAETTPSVVLGVKTPVVSGYITDNNRTKLRKEKMKEYCNKLRKEDLNSFHQECCLNNLVSDPRCTLGALFNAYQEQHQEEVSQPVTVKTTVENPFVEPSPAEKDVSRLGKALDLDEDLAEGGNKTEESTAREKVENISSWKSKYFTVLGFFLVFLVIFVVVIVALIYKIRKSKAGSAPVSPGAGMSVTRAGRSRQGYANFLDENGEDGVPLTPATEQAQAFQY